MKGDPWRACHGEALCAFAVSNLSPSLSDSQNHWCQNHFRAGPPQGFTAKTRRSAGIAHGTHGKTRKRAQIRKIIGVKIIFGQGRRSPASPLGEAVEDPLRGLAIGDATDREPDAFGPEIGHDGLKLVHPDIELNAFTRLLAAFIDMEPVGCDPVTGPVDPLDRVQFGNPQQTIEVLKGLRAVQVVDVRLREAAFGGDSGQEGFVEHGLGDHAGEVIGRDVPLS